MAKEQIKITKAELVEEIHERTQFNRKDIKLVIDEYIRGVKEALYDRQTVELRGFGTFSIKTRKGRDKVRNPKTGEALPSTEEHGVVVFRPGKEFKKRAWFIVEPHLD